MYIHNMPINMFGVSRELGLDSVNRYTRAQYVYLVKRLCHTEVIEDVYVFHHCFMQVHPVVFFSTFS